MGVTHGEPTVWEPRVWELPVSEPAVWEPTVWEPTLGPKLGQRILEPGVHSMRAPYGALQRKRCSGIAIMINTYAYTKHFSTFMWAWRSVSWESANASASGCPVSASSYEKKDRSLARATDCRNGRKTSTTVAQDVDYHYLYYCSECYDSLLNTRTITYYGLSVMTSQRGPAVT